MQNFLRIAKRPSIVKQSLIIAAIVGTILNLINQGDVMTGASTFNLIKCVLTYMVPYCVSTYGAVMALRGLEKMQAEGERFTN